MERDQEAISELWEHGIVAAHYLRDDQIPVYNFLRNTKSPHLEAARRYGKTTSILCYVLEKLRQNPGWVCRWCEPEKEQARLIVMPEIEKIQEHCPEALQFKYKETDTVYIGPGNSRIYLTGVNKDRGKSARGSFAHIIVADEFGFWTCPEIVESILQPQLLTTRGQMIIASTPPEDLGHPYYRKKELAMRQNRFFQRTIYDNGMLSKEDIEKAIEDSGGISSPTFQREYLCMEVGDPEQRVIPEFSDERNVIPDTAPRPHFFDAYVGGDSGADDNTVILYGYYDFVTDTVVIDDELVTAGKPTAEIIAQAKKDEVRLWGHQQPFRRVYDADKQLLIDIVATHKYTVYAPEKTDKRAAIHALRQRVQSGKLKIRARCKNTIRQMKVGQWHNERHMDFARNEDLGHLDAIAAAVYLNRSIITNRNPVPHNLGVDVSTHHYNPSDPKKGTEEAVIAEIFGLQ